MYKYVIWYDGGFLRDSSEFEGGLYEDYEDAEIEANWQKESYMDSWETDGCEYDSAYFDIEIIEVETEVDEDEEW